MAHACKEPGKKTHQAGVKAYADLAKITSIHPKATFGPEDTEVTMRQLLRRSVEKTGHCIGVSVDKSGEFHADEFRALLDVAAGEVEELDPARVLVRRFGIEISSG